MFGDKTMILNNFTLLYVEDDISTQKALKDILRLNVKDLYIASDGQEGLELYKELNPDIVLTDINMPNMNGIYMSQKIKEINPHQPIAILTAFNEPSFLKQAVNLGVDKYIIKPVTNVELLFQPLESIAKVLQLDKNNKELEHMMQAQSKIASMGEMLGNIAHQWRQPLSMISTYASGLNMKIEMGEKISEEELKKCSQSVIDQTLYLSQTIDDFRNFLKDNTYAESKQYNIKDTVHKVINLVKDSYKNNNITIVLNCDDCIMNYNENQLLQALLNILNNASDAFVINTIKNNQRFLFIDLKKEKNNILLTIKDSAGGIDLTIIDKIFEPYFTTKHHSVGTGIGLYMTHQIITKHLHGTIEVSNKEYIYNNDNFKGACFTIKLSI